MRHIDKRMNWLITYNKEKRSGEKEWEAVEIKRKTSRGIGNCKEDSRSKTALLETKKWFFFYFFWESTYEEGTNNNYKCRNILNKLSKIFLHLSCLISKIRKSKTK